MTQPDDSSIEHVRTQFALAERIERNHLQALGEVRSLKRLLAMQLIRAQHGKVTVKEMDALLANMGCS